MKYSVIFVGLILGAVSTMHAGKIQFIEQFALSQDREQTLKQLIPGTEDYYYYHCLHYQNTEQFDRVNGLLTNWIKRYGERGRVREIQNRQFLLTYHQQPLNTIEHLTKSLNLRFDHTRPRISKDQKLPNSLDQKLIDRNRLTTEALRRSKNLSAFQNSALDWLSERNLTPTQRRDLLARLERPDVPKLVDHVVADLRHKGSGGFGSLAIHRRMLLSQLDQLAKLQPQLKNQQNFVATYVARLAPDNDTNWQNNPEATRKYLERLWSFVGKLEPTHNSLKAHVLYQRLAFDESQGEYNQARFLQYLKLPRNVPYANRDFLRRPDSRRYPVQLNQNFRAYTKFPPIRNDEALVRRYLQHFFVKNTNYKPYAPYVNDTYLKHLFAETKIVNGLGDAEQWYSMLPPDVYQKLKDRVDLDFVPESKKIFKSNDQVSVDLAVKNVEKLIVKVYEINTNGFYRQHQRPINTDINLDGLVANSEKTYEYAEAPVIRKVRHFDFPELTKPGVFVIDFIGNGKSNRLVVRKGRLRHLQRQYPNGHIFTVLNDQNEVIDDASIWMGDREYTAGENGLILIPYSTSPRRQSIVLSNGEFSSLATFQHRAESYTFSAGIHVDDEALVDGHNATVVIRPNLRINGYPADPELLTKTSLTITSNSLDGIQSQVKVDDIKLTHDAEFLHQFRVPARLTSLNFVVSGTVKSKSTGKEQVVSASKNISLNGIAKTTRIEDLYLAKYGSEYVAELLGRSGEPKANRAVRFDLRHRDFKRQITTTLQTDQQGRIRLGTLEGISQLRATGPEGARQTWFPPQDNYTLLPTIHGTVGDIITIPYLSNQDGIQRTDLSLLELRGSHFVADRFENASISKGFLKIADLPAGDYSLLLKGIGKRCRIRIAEGTTKLGFVLGKSRHLELSNTGSIHVPGITEKDGSVRIQLANFGDASRVHIFAKRFLTKSTPYSNLGGVNDANPVYINRSELISLYADGRVIGDELRYILDRQYAIKLPGNMLQRPSLLLNPWDIRSTQTDRQTAADGDEFDAKEEAVDSEMAPNSALDRKSRQALVSGQTSFDFLQSGAPLIANLKPDKNGIVTVDAKLLEGRQHLQIVAVDPLSIAYRTVSLAKSSVKFRDLRLLDGFDPTKHFTQQKSVHLTEGGKFEVGDLTTAKFEKFDSLTSVYELYRSLNQDPNLVKFQFVLNWPNLGMVEKQKLYSEHACHELNFFLYQKDPEFFDKVIQPYLQHKLHATFMDDWLLKQDLTAYLNPYRFQQLNIAERILMSQRLDEQNSSIVRHINDLASLLVVDRDREDRLFLSSLTFGAMSGSETSEAIRSRSRRAKKNKGIRKESALFANDDVEFGLAEVEDKSLNGNVEFDALAAPQLSTAAAADGAVAGGGFGGGGRGGRLARGRSMERFQSGFAGKMLRQKQLYRQIEKTREWVENNYYRLPIEAQNQELIAVNAFWNDYAQHLANHGEDKPFLSENWNKATRNFTEMMLALSVLDLPFQAEKPKLHFDEDRLTIEMNGPAILVKQQVAKSSDPIENSPVLVSQNFFKANDRSEVVNGRRIDKFISDEFLVHEVYGCQVVVTNPSSSQQDIDVLTQIPNGTIPVAGSKETKTSALTLAPYETKRIEFLFYFPSSGSFDHYPVHVSNSEDLLMVADAKKFKVVDEATTVDQESWNYVAGFGSEDEVLTFLKNKNLHKVDLGKIAFRMAKKQFFNATIKQLKSRHVYNHLLWSYAVKHNVAPFMREYLAHSPMVHQVGASIDSPLLTVNPVEYKKYQHMEYWPLVNARAHQLGEEREILNNRFFEQYHRLMSVLSTKRNLESSDLLAVTHYLLLQDRVTEAQSFFGRVQANQLDTRMQYDYCAAYLDCFDEDLTLARSLVAQYADHPVPRWKNTFAAVGKLLAEIEGSSTSTIDEDNRDEVQSQLASKEPTFDFKVKDRQVEVQHQNVESAQVNYYLMDLEVLFSRNPFVKSFGDQFSSIRPNHSQRLEFTQDAASTTFEVPDKLQNQNVLIEVSAAGKTRSAPLFSNALSVQVMQNFGQLNVYQAGTEKPLPTTYVKVYARNKNGQVKFYKDGYTDLRGRFDYSSLSTNDLDSVTHFAILVMSDKHGAVVREVAPPKR